MSPLLDTFGRRHDYLRISLTDRCNLRCRYCMPAAGVALRAREEFLSFDELELLARLFVLLGIRKIRLTGGEPLLRRNIEELCVRLSSIPGLATLALTTNGTMLEEKARALSTAGVRQVNISLDTLRPERFERMTLRTSYESVLRGIGAAAEAGFEAVKINTVVMRGFNEDEVLDFVAFAQERALVVRFIEFMPFRDNGWHEGGCVTCCEMREMIEQKYDLIPIVREDRVYGPSRDFLVAGSLAVVGFITTMSEHFCHACNRLRLSADGTLRNCLFAPAGTNLKTLLRNGASMEDLEEAIGEVVRGKWKHHPDADELVGLNAVPMVALGG